MSTAQTSHVRMTEIRPGDLVFIDCFLGLIPAKVTGYATWGHIKVLVTAERPGYRRGEHTAVAPSHCIPRAHVRVRSGHERIFGAWTFDGLPDEFQPRWAWN